MEGWIQIKKFGSKLLSICMTEVQQCKSVKHSGFIMVCECICCESVVSTLNWIMNAENCGQIFIHHTVSSGKSLIDKGFIFQYGNNHKLHANVAKAYLDRKNTLWNTMSMD